MDRPKRSLASLGRRIKSIFPFTNGDHIKLELASDRQLEIRKTLETSAPDPEIDGGSENGIDGPAEYESASHFNEVFFECNKSYRYPTLSAGQIRLAIIQPGQPNEELKCAIRIVRLDGYHPYEALSYVWGDDSEPGEIQCENERFVITKNLSAALIQLRQPNSQRILWIDQLCVDQRNLAERSSQVNMMGNIFKQARQVICWLGPDLNNEANLARETIQDLANSPLQKHEDGMGKLCGGFGKITDEFLEDMQLPCTTSPKWQALNHLIRCPYFERVWIMQEVELASAKSLLWGDCELSWDSIMSVLPWEIDMGMHALLQEPLLDPIGMGKVKSPNAPPHTFEECLSAAALRKSSDHRDKTFAVLNLVGGGAPFSADYEMTLLETYRRTAVYLIRERKNLHFMSHIDNSSVSQSKALTWPSWLPRYWGHIAGPDQISFSASGSIPLQMASMDFSGSTVLFRGIKHGTVQILNSKSKSQIGLPAIQIEDTILKINQAWDAMRVHAKVWRYEKEFAIKALLRTMTCGLYDLKVKACGEEPAISIYDDLLYDFVKFWETILKCYLGHKGPDGASLVESSAALGRSAILDALGYYNFNPPVQAKFESFSLSLQQFWDGQLWSICTIELLDTCYMALNFALSKADNRQELEEVFRARFPSTSLDSPELEKAMTAISDISAFVIGKPNSFSKMWQQSGLHKRFFITDNGYMGMGPAGMREGDITAVFTGGSVPFILRPFKDGFHIIGSCYIHGIMNGELILNLEERWETGADN